MNTDTSLVLLLKLTPSVWRRYNVDYPSKPGWIVKTFPFDDSGAAQAISLANRRRPVSAHLLRVTQNFEKSSDLLIHAMMCVADGKGKQII